MTTIHVTIDDHAEALGVVATLLNQGYEVSIDLDLVPQRVEPDYMSDPDYMSTERVAIHEKLWGKSAKRSTKPIIDARGEQSPPIVAYGVHVGHDGSDYFIDGRKVSATEFEHEMRMRAQARDERRAEAHRAIYTVGCDACGARTGDQCRSASGKGYSDSFVHIDRIRALHTMNEAVRVDKA